jgi:hypothetical protein
MDNIAPVYHNSASAPTVKKFKIILHEPLGHASVFCLTCSYQQHATKTMICVEKKQQDYKGYLEEEKFCGNKLPYLSMYKSHFDKYLPSKIWVRLIHRILCPLDS